MSAGKINAFSRWQSATLAAVVDSAELAWKEKLVLLVLVRHANDSGVSYPSKKTVCAKAGLGWGAVRAAIRGAVRKGWLLKTLRCTPRFGWETNLFCVRQPAARGGGEGFVATHGFVGSMDPTNPLTKKGSGSLEPSSLQLLSETPPGGVGGTKRSGGKGPDLSTPEIAEAVHIVAACTDVERRVGTKLARSEFHRLASALLAKGLGLGLLVVAAEQYGGGRGPWRQSRTLAHGVTAIADDVLSWSATVERRAKRIDQPPARSRAASSPVVAVSVLSAAEVAKAAKALATLGTGDGGAPPRERSIPRRVAAGTGISRGGSK